MPTRRFREADALGVVIDAGHALLPVANLVSVTLRSEEGTFDTVAASDPLAVRLDELQYRLREGPCVVACRLAALSPFASSDVGADPRVARWGPAAVEHGVQSVLSVGLFAHRTPARVGALNFMSFSRGGLDTADHGIAMVLAAHTTAVLDARAQAATAAQLNADLRNALRNRDVIGQAKGILMERQGIDDAEAFEILRSVSERMNVGPELFCDLGYVSRTVRVTTSCAVSTIVFPVESACSRILPSASSRLMSRRSARTRAATATMARSGPAGLAPKASESLS